MNESVFKPVVEGDDPLALLVHGLEVLLALGNASLGEEKQSQIGSIFSSKFISRLV